MRTRFTVVLGLVLTLGCASDPSVISHLEMAARMSYQGFSFDRPPNRNWFLRRAEEHHTDVLLRRELQPASPTHSFFASVSLSALERQPRSHAEFAELARQTGQTVPYQTTRVSYEQEPMVRQGQWCVRLRSVDTVTGSPAAPDAELTIVIRGFRCLHPAFPKGVLDFFYSERGLAAELDPRLYEEGEEFLDGVRIDVAPDTPAS